MSSCLVNVFNFKEFDKLVTSGFIDIEKLVNDELYQDSVIITCFMYFFTKFLSRCGDRSISDIYTYILWTVNEYIKDITQ